ncbi:MAG: hypothetical protein M5R41_19175 [Bacteroidia bacterium]|nr:hypothetical protein [Bacteroidia bacterium]
MELQRTRPKKLSRKEAEFEKQRFEFYQSERGGHLDKRAIESWELYHNDRDGTNTQYTKKQIEALEHLKSPVVSMNMIMPIIQNQKAVLTADRPTGRVMPSYGEYDKRVAKLYDALLGAMWQRSYGDAHYKKAIKDMLITYIGCMIVEPQTFYRRGKFNLTFDHVSWQDLYIDPSAKRSGLCFEDAECIYVAKVMPKRKVRNIYGFVPEDRGNFIKTEWNATAEEQDNENVLIRNAYEKVYGIYCLLNVTNPEAESHYVTRRVFASEAELDAFRKKYQAKLVRYTENVYMRRRTIVGYEDMIEEKMLPLTVYPMAVYTPDDFDNPFGKSPVEFLREMQKAMNKFIQTTILNANVGSHIRLIAAQGSIINRDAVVKNGAAAGGLIEYKPDPNLPNNGAPTPLYPAPLAAAWFQLGNFMKDAMEYSAGRPAFTQGDPSQSPNTATASSQIASFADLRPRDIRSRCETATAMMYKAAVEYINYYGNREEIVRYIDDRDEIVDIPLADILDDNNLIEHDVVMSTKSSLPTDRVEMRNDIRLALQQTADPGWQKFLFLENIEMSDSPAAERIRKKLDMFEEMNGQIQQLQEQLEERDKLIDRLSTEVIVGKQQVAVAKLDGDVKAMKAETKAKMQVALAKVEQGDVGEQAQQQIEEM